MLDRAKPSRSRPMARTARLLGLSSAVGAGTWAIAGLANALGGTASLMVLTLASSALAATFSPLLEKGVHGWLRTQVYRATGNGGRPPGPLRRWMTNQHKQMYQQFFERYEGHEAFGRDIADKAGARLERMVGWASDAMRASDLETAAENLAQAVLTRQYNYPELDPEHSQVRLLARLLHMGQPSVEALAWTRNRVLDHVHAFDQRLADDSSLLPFVDALLGYRNVTPASAQRMP